MNERGVHMHAPEPGSLSCTAFIPSGPGAGQKRPDGP